MATCNRCKKSGLFWKTTSGGRMRLELHECNLFTTEGRKPKIVFNAKKDYPRILEGVMLTEEALTEGLLEELGL